MGLSFLTLQRRNAVGDALRHKSALRRILKTGRRAPGTACDAERRTIVELSFLRLQESLGCIQRPASSSWPRATAARTCSGAVPPIWLRALTEPSRVSTANTSCSIWLLN
ncbi:hypothetical protein XJ28_00345 [Pseudomonas syringae pv. tomato]|nr:hypothetical protein XJ28_00345 [Pseudomonas syringae pv. tomato]